MSSLLDTRKNYAAGLLATGKRQSAVAKELGVSRQTISRWAKDPEFQGALSEFSPAPRPGETNPLGVLRGLLSSSDEKVRMRAAQLLLLYDKDNDDGYRSDDPEIAALAKRLEEDYPDE